MKISFENPDKINGLMTIVIEENDYKANFEKSLKDYRKRANMPGFRPGQVPMGIIKKQVGSQLKMDTINNLLGEELNKYLKDNNIKMLGQPMGSTKQEPVDIEKEAPYTFMFDIAVAPEFKAELNEKDTVPYYNINIDDELIDKQIDMFASRAGHYDKVEQYNEEKRDMLKGDLRELDENGNTLENGIVVEGAVLMPQYIKVDEQKKLFDNAKLGDIIIFNPRKAYPNSDAEISSLLKIERNEVANHTGNFSYQITEISRYVHAENNKELWDKVYGAEAKIEDEKGFRKAISDGLAKQLQNDSDHRFIMDLRTYMEKKVRKLKFPDEILKRVMIANNKDKGKDFVEKNYDKSIDELRWHLIKEELALANDIKVDDSDVKDVAAQMARAQFAQYGMNNVPDEYINKYADEALKKRENIDSFVEAALDTKLAEKLKTVVKLQKKKISLDDFNKLFEPEAKDDKESK